MRKLFDEVTELVEKHSLDPSTHLCKLAEEHGEIAKEINRFTGVKKRGIYTDEQIRENVKDEICDNIQVLFAIARCMNITFDELCDRQRFIIKIKIYFFKYNFVY